MTAGGRVVVPAALRKALGLDVGDEVLMRLENNEVRFYTRAEAIRQAQAMVQRYVPEGVSLVDELLEERRREVEREERQAAASSKRRKASG